MSEYGVGRRWGYEDVMRVVSSHVVVCVCVMFILWCPPDPLTRCCHTCQECQVLSRIAHPQLCRSKEKDRTPVRMRHDVTGKATLMSNGGNKTLLNKKGRVAGGRMCHRRSVLMHRLCFRGRARVVSACEV